MTVSLKASADGTQGIIQVGGNDVVVASATGLAPATGKTIEATSGPNSSAFSFRNKIINGDMNIAQRGTSFAAIATGTYTLDRFQWQQSGAGVGTMSQQADAPSSNEFQNSLRYAVTTTDASIAAGDIYYIRHAVEGYSARDLIGRTFTLSFWVRSSKTGTHCVSFSNSTSDRSYVADYTINSANTWEQKSITVSGGLITAGTWNWTNGVGIVLSFALAAGTTYQTTANAWQTGSFYATSNQVNCLDTIGNIFAITGVQLEAGSVATPFEHRPYGTELALCQRYFFRTSIGVPSTASYAATFAFKVTMRATPTITGGGTGFTLNTTNDNPNQVLVSQTSFAIQTLTADIEL